MVEREETSSSDFYSQEEDKEIDLFNAQIVGGSEIRFPDVTLLNTRREFIQDKGGLKWYTPQGSYEPDRFPEIEALKKEWREGLEAARSIQLNDGEIIEVKTPNSE